MFLHEGGFYTGDLISGNLRDPEVDLTASGYYVFVVAYRLAPCGLVAGQACHTDPSSGRPPEQTDDVKAFIRAVRADSRFNGKLGVVGGSAGGSHAAFVALDTTASSGWPNWTSSDRPDVAVCLSGAYDLADRTQENYPDPPGDPLPAFVSFVENYTNTCVRIDPSGGPDQRSVSPVAKIPSPTAVKPMYFINSQNDSMPYQQIIDIQCALQMAGVDSSLYRVLTIPDSNEHAFSYWSSWNGRTIGPTVLIKGDVISFLDSYLK